MGTRFRAVVGWLSDPSHKGRKRGVAAALLATSAALRVYGQSEIADVAEGFNAIVQDVEVGLELGGFLFMVIGLADAKRKASK